ncbi:MAG: hypothetical protein HOP28_06670 [Gemmatimonadales bacterium]|nr:hypothetical protein [Gemmatimonadales bacterium]
MLFLIEYDRTSGELISLRSFRNSDRNAAERERLTLELDLNRRQVKREVVLLEARTEKALRLTHRRYFETLTELSKTKIA